MFISFYQGPKIVYSYILYASIQLYTQCISEMTVTMFVFKYHHFRWYIFNKFTTRYIDLESQYIEFSTLYIKFTTRYIDLIVNILILKVDILSLQLNILSLHWVNK